MKVMKDYDNLYLKCDILLLAVVFEKFRNNRLKNYGFCPGHYLNVPGLSWDAMLEWQKLSVKLLLILTCLYSLKKLQEVEFLIFIIDIAKRTMSIENLMVQNKNKNMFCI